MTDMIAFMVVIFVGFIALTLLTCASIVLIKRGRRCDFYKHCNIYRKDSVTCNEEMGSYSCDPFDFRPVGCYRDLEANGKQSKYWIDKRK